MRVIESTIWAEKYRPRNIDQYVGNPDFISKVRGWIDAQDVPHIILHSEKSGTGKTTLCKLLAAAIGADTLYINASSENGIDTVREKISAFAYTAGFSKWKVVILDEFSMFSLSAQSALNSIIEATGHDTRFFLTGNYIEKFLPSIVSRCTPFLIQTPPPREVFANIAGILTKENIKFSKDDLLSIVRKFYPDQRAMLMYCQSNSIGGELKFVEQAAAGEYCDWILKELTNTDGDVKTKFSKIRQIIADAKVRQFDDLFTYLYAHTDDFAPDGKKAQAILHIADYQQRSTLVIDKEIQVAAMFINLLRDLK